MEAAGHQKPIPSSWTAHEVSVWAARAGLPVEATRAITENQIDGPTLTTLTKEEIRTELGITSLPIRRYLWDQIERLRKQQEAMDHASAVFLFRAEVKTLEHQNRSKDLDAAGTGTKDSIDSMVLQVLHEETNAEMQIASDRLMAIRVSEGQIGGFQSYQDSHTAQLEQVCIRNNINVAQAFASGRARPIIRATRPTESVRAAGARSTEVASRQSQEQLEKLQNKRTRHPIAASNVAAHSVSRSKPRPLNTLLKRLPRIDRCSVCSDDNERGFTFTCGHKQCVDCMTRHLRVALNDRSLLPLKCCEQPIDMTSIPSLLLDPAEVALLKTRTEEVTAKSKMYCPSCNRFINLDSVDQAITGRKLMCECRQLLCVECKTGYHPALTCAENQQAAKATDESLDRLASAEGWKRCPSCSIMIELAMGCYHMTCSNCTHEFCFHCLSRWNTSAGLCSNGCVAWDENRLNQAAEARVDEQLGARRAARPAPSRGPTAAPAQTLVNPFERQRLVAREMSALRGNEQCCHIWNRRSMRYRRCERCGYELNWYGMVCNAGCGSTVCYTCAHHRIGRWGWR